MRSKFFIPALLVVVGLAACDILSPGDPEIARVVIESASSDVRLVVSNDFNAVEVSGQGVGQIVLVSSDTVDVTAGFEQRYTLGGRLRFYARAAAPDSIPVVASMSVYIDDKLRFSETREIAGETLMEFIYVFADPII